MAEFASYREYWQFADTVRRRLRYARDAAQDSFLAAVLETSQSRHQTLPAGTHLWRAQLGSDWGPLHIGDDEMEDVLDEVPEPFGPERMRPLADKAKEGRANPKGIPYLYLSTRQAIAIAEVRPWIGSHVSVGEFVLAKDVRVINTKTKDRNIRFYESEPEPEERERAVWRDIDEAFSRPVTSSDDTADYAPTQVLAEFFKEHGLAGIAYGSALGEGHNIVLFDLQAATLRACGLVEITSISFESSMAANPYFINVDKDDKAKAVEKPDVGGSVPENTSQA